MSQTLCFTKRAYRGDLYCKSGSSKSANHCYQLRAIIWRNKCSRLFWPDITRIYILSQPGRIAQVIDVIRKLIGRKHTIINDILDLLW